MKEDIKVLIGQTYLQKARNSQMPAIKVALINKNRTAIPVARGLATKVVDKVPVTRKRNNLVQPLFNHSGHLRLRPKN